MEYEINFVPKGHLHYVIPAIIPYLQKSEYRSGGRSSIDDILEFVLTGQMYLFVVFEKGTNRICGHFIAEIQRYPQFSMLNARYAAGDTGILTSIQDQIVELMEGFAKSAGCKGVEFYGRKGWLRSMKKRGYKAKSIIFEKIFDGEPT